MPSFQNVGATCSWWCCRCPSVSGRTSLNGYLMRRCRRCRHRRCGGCRRYRLAEYLAGGWVFCWRAMLRGMGIFTLGYDKGVERGAIWRTGAGGVCDWEKSLTCICGWWLAAGCYVFRYRDCLYSWGVLWYRERIQPSSYVRLSRSSRWEKICLLACVIANKVKDLWKGVCGM